MGTPSQSYGTSFATWDHHTVLPATRHKWTRPGRLSWARWLDGTPAGSRTSDLSITSPTPNRCTIKTTCRLVQDCRPPGKSLSSRTNFQVLVLVLILESQVLDNNTDVMWMLTGRTLQCLRCSQADVWTNKLARRWRWDMTRCGRWRSTEYTRYLWVVTLSLTDRQTDRQRQPWSN